MLDPTRTNLSANRHWTACVMVALTLLLPADRLQAADTKTALTIYSTAQPGAISPDMYMLNANQPNRGRRFDIPGYATVKQEREFKLDEGMNTIRFSDVAAEIEPTTVMFQSLTDPTGTHVIEQNYEFDLVSSQKLMERYLDKKITLEQIQGDSIGTFTGTLLSTSGGVVLKSDEGKVQIVSHYTNVLLPELPGGLITKPTLVWQIAAGQAGQQQARVTYQTGAMTWWTDYNIVYAEADDANSGLLDLGAWVSIINQSGASYPDAKLKLIAGDVHRVEKPRPYAPRRAMAMDMAEGARAPGFEEKAFFEYHLYTLGRPTTLPDNSTKQIELFPPARNVPCEKVLVYYGLDQGFRGFFPEPMTDRNFGTQSNKKVDVYLRFKNSEEAGLGMPLPSGRIRVSKQDPADGTLEFIGEDTIDHTPKDEEVLIKLGNAFDVVGERKQVDFKVDTRRNWMDETIEIALRNHKEEAVKVIVKENLYRWVNWKITEATHEYTKEDARTVHFPVQLKPDEEATIRYTVHYSW